MAITPEKDTMVTEEEIEKEMLLKHPQGAALGNGKTQDVYEAIYTCFFRHQINHLQSKSFRCSGGLQAARERAEKHCSIMGYKFNFVQPFISDLEREEAYQLGNGRAFEESRKGKVKEDAKP